jgi:hypothetical protein
MKTKAFLMVCLLLGIGLTQLSAQNGTDVGRDIYYNYWGPVWSSNGDQIDVLRGDVAEHFVNHFVNGVYVTFITTFYGEVKSVGFYKDGVKIGGTGEVFTIKDQFKSDLTSTTNIGGGHVHAKGDQGSDYMIFYEYKYDWSVDPPEETITFVKAVSFGSKK